MAHKTPHDDDLMAALKKRRAEALAIIASAEKAQKIVAEIDVFLSRMVEIGTEQAPPPTNGTVTPTVSKVSTQKRGAHGTSYPVQVLAILKRTPGKPMQARAIIEEIGAVQDPIPVGKARRTLDVSVRNAISNLYKDPASGVEKVSYGYYRWTPEPAKDAPEGEQNKP
jgi:hypothetical protein